MEGLHESTAVIRAQLARLAAAGLVEPRGVGRARRYHLAAAFYRLAEATAYVRLQDTDPIQQEQMVLSYVERFGSITRGKAAELCRLDPGQARRLLQRLTADGRLELVGECRGPTTSAARPERPGRSATRPVPRRSPAAVRFMAGGGGRLLPACFAQRRRTWQRTCRAQS